VIKRKDGHKLTSFYGAQQVTVRSRRGHERAMGERVCCLLVLDSVTSTPQWIRQPKPRDVHDVYVFVCKCVLSSPRASQPLNVFAYAFSSTSAFSLRLMTLRLAGGATPAFIGVSAPPLPSLTAAQRIHPPRNCPMLTVGYNNTTITAL